MRDRQADRHIFAFCHQNPLNCYKPTCKPMQDEAKLRFSNARPRALEADYLLALENLQKSKYKDILISGNRKVDYYRIEE